MSGMSLTRYRDLADDPGRRRLATAITHGKLQAVSRGIYARPPASDEERLLALFLRLPAGTLLGMHSAAERYGFGTLHSDQVHVVIPPKVAKPRIRGVVAHESALATPEPTLLGGIPCVPAARCAIDLARAVRRLDALPVLDAALRAGACDLDDLLAEGDRHRGLPGVRQARELAAMADGRAECRQESQLRLIVIDGRLPTPEPQVWVEDGLGTTRYRLDLGYREQLVGLEYDGASHTYRDQLRYDRARMNWLAAQGWRMRYFTDRDLYWRPYGIVTAVRAALQR